MTYTIAPDDGQTNWPKHVEFHDKISFFFKLVHLVGFITKKVVTMHGHMNVNKKEDVSRSSDLLFFLNGVTVFYTIVSLPRSAVPFTLKAAQFKVIALQHSLHCCKFWSAYIFHRLPL